MFSKDGYLLLGKSKNGGVYQGMWIVPGGGIEEGETEIEALIRETREETGIDVSGWKLDRMDLSMSGESEKLIKPDNERVRVVMNFINFVTTAPDSHEEMSIECDDDFVDAEWHAPTSLSTLALTPPIRKSLLHLGYL
jgi:8-oxo-dGTP pyrophosphatase MutT (NUDIX family)